MEHARDSAASAEVVRLDQGNELMLKAVERTLVGIAVVDLAGRLVQANDAFHDIVGRARGESLGKDIRSIMLGADAASTLRINYLASGETDDHRAECQLMRDDGATIWVFARACMLKADQPGEAAHISLQIIDIDRQKRAEAAFAYSETRWTVALEAAVQGVWEYDRRVGTMFHSPSWNVLRGYAPDEHIDPSREAWLARAHPDDVAHILANVERQRLGDTDFDTLEYRERHRDGRYIWILSRGKPVEWDADGTPIRTIGTDTDITRLKVAEEELAAEKERLRVTLESIGDGVISTDSVGRVTFMNATAELMTGWSTADAAGRKIEQVFSIFEEDSGHVALGPVGRCIADGKLVCIDAGVVLIGRDNERRDVRSIATPLWLPDGRIVGAVLVFQDITTSRKLQRELAHTATHDVLTELPNRLAFQRALVTVTEQVRRELRSSALCLIDLDRFKEVNDNAGHAAGDALLRKVADVLRRSCRRQDFAARIGGDEFALLLPDCTAGVAARAMQGVADAVAALNFEWEGRRYSVGASIGITTIGGDSVSLAETMSQADAACYASKAAGRGRVSVYDPLARPAT